jgi:hypothetical protein
VHLALKFAILRKGVAQISVPNNVQKEPLDPSACASETCLGAVDIAPDTKELAKAVRIIDSSERPIIVAGWGAYPFRKEVLTLATRLKAPIVTTWRAKGIIPEDNEWVAGIHGNVGPLRQGTGRGFGPDDRTRRGILADDRSSQGKEDSAGGHGSAPDREISGGGGAFATARPPSQCWR